jgi:hypothetical protein
MTLLRSGVDLATIALWLGHEDLRTVQIYLHADLQLKERALARTTPPNTTPGRYRPPDPVLAFLESLRLCRTSRPRHLSDPRHGKPPAPPRPRRSA